jgi:hypothetical protein
MLRWCGVSLLAMSLTGCVISVEPVVTDSDAIFDDRLLGTWESDSDLAVVTHDGETAYAIEFVSEGEVSQFEARLGRLEDRYVLDVWSTIVNDLPDATEGMLVAGHLLFDIRIEADEVSAAMLKPGAILEALESGELSLAHRNSDSEEHVLLYGSTEQLRSALEPYLASSNALYEPNLWRRVSDAVVAVQSIAAEIPCFEASAWREADELFHSDPHWLGADVASSVDLGNELTLWLFGDTWIDSTGKGTRESARIVSNSVAIQAGSDPSTATISFHWGKAEDGSPTAFFPDREDESLWFGNGVLVDDRLVLFFSRTTRNTGTGLGFQSVGWTAVMIENPYGAPSTWRARPLDTPTNQLGIAVGFAAVLTLDEYVYALGSQDPVKSHPIFAARWPIEQVHRGDLMNPEWWSGNRLGWVANSSAAPRWPIFENGQSELTVHMDKDSQQFLAVHTRGFGSADLTMRAARELTGSWTSPRMIYRPPEYHRPNIMIYAGKAHPQLDGADLVLTYATNTFSFPEHLTNELSYYPRFVRLMHCEKQKQPRP